MALLDLTNEYNALRGGNWYYTQNKPGTKWFDTVNNSTGWTVDFTLQVSDVENSDIVIDENSIRGAGFYINDGNKQEIITFLTQEILFNYANESIVFDTTEMTDYRIIGKDNSIKIYAKKNSQDKYVLVKESTLSQDSYNFANGYKPSVVEDINGKLYAVWHDDGYNNGQIIFSTFESNTWSSPEVISTNIRGCQFVDILVDNDYNVFVVYETKHLSNSSIGMVYKNNLGWSDPLTISSSNNLSKNPKIAFDSQYNIILVWEEYDFGKPEIYYSKFDINRLEWSGEQRLTITEYGAFDPSITSYLDNVYISYTLKKSNGKSVISVLSYNTLTSSINKTVDVSDEDGFSINSDILINSAGKSVVVWQDIITGKSEIYGTVLNTDLEQTVSVTRVTEGYGSAQYPKLSEQMQTGNVYVVWFDNVEGNSTSYVPIIYTEDEYDSITFNEPYLENITDPTQNVDTRIYVSYFSNVRNQFVSSSNDEDPSTIDIDMLMNFADNRICMFPSVPYIFRNEMPIVYETYLVDDNFLLNEERFRQIGGFYYDLTVSLNGIFDVTYDNDNPEDDKDYLISKIGNRKELRFGDFSNTLNIHYIFQNISYYTKDAVEPFTITEINSEDVLSNSFSNHDVVINNYGDIWAVGTHGALFYITKSGLVSKVGSQDESSIVGPEGNSKVISLDNNGYLYISIGGNLYYSIEHIDGFKSEPILSLENDITSICFNTDSKLFVGTANGLSVYDVAYGINGEVSLTSNNSLLNGKYITCIKSDVNNMVWIGTHQYLFRYYNNQLNEFTIENGLPSNRINDITIRNSAIRYIATSNGIAKMIGNGVDFVIKSENSNLWNNNVKCVKWQNPNILWAGTISKLNQILVDDNNNFTTVVYEPNFSYNIDKDDTSIYYIIPIDDVEMLDNDIYEVYINGQLISHGFKIGYDNTTNQRIVKFETQLKSDDIVEIVLRKDLSLESTFVQSDEEKQVLGSTLEQIENLQTTEDGLLYIATKGDINEIKVNDGINNLPFDRVHLDTIPPIGFLSIPENAQVDKSLIKLNIAAQDGGLGSGVESMVLSNNEDFVDENGVSLEPVDFQSIAIHDIGLSLNNVVKQLSFSDVDAIGNSISIFNIDNQTVIYAGSKSDANLYKYSFFNSQWDKILSYGEDKIIDFIAYYNEKVIVSVGDEIDTATLYVYSYSSNGLSLDTTLPISESRAYSYEIINNVFYVCSGLGEVNEYGAYDGSGLYGGRIYKLTDIGGLSLTVVVSDIDNNIYDITYSEKTDKIFASTGESGFVYEVDYRNNAASTIHNDNETLTSIEYYEVGAEGYLFTGGESKGIIKRSPSDDNSYNISFQTSPAKVSVIKTGNFVNREGENETVLYSVIGNSVYYLSNNNVWVWKYTHSEEIKDIAINNENGNIYIISNNDISFISANTSTKNIYLKLIDRAGNESEIYDINGNLKDEENENTKEESIFVQSITISDLANFVNENKIFKINQSGVQTVIKEGDSPHYDAIQIDEEKGVYESEIFDGTNNLVKWDNISWKATELSNTKVYIYVRTHATSKNDILLEDWVGPYNIGQSSGVDLSHLSGRYIQFKVELISEIKGTTPSFHSANIRAITSDAIHFFTTNFVLPSAIRKGIITSTKMIPVSADIIFGINTTNSIDWSQYQIVEEDRIFNSTQTGENLRVGIQLISPNRRSYDIYEFDEYGPYGSDLLVNTIDFNNINNTGSDRYYHFKVELYSDVLRTNKIYEAYSYESLSGFSVDNQQVTSDGVFIEDGDFKRVVFSPPSSANIQCNTYYYAKVISVYDFDEEATMETVVFDDYSYIINCGTSFVDTISFDFENAEAVSKDFNFRIKFYEDPSRTNLFYTAFSGNNSEGWFYDDIMFNTDGSGVELSSHETKTITYRPDVSLFENNKVFYLTIDTYDINEGSFDVASNEYTFRVSDTEDLIYCGDYSDVPVVKNFSFMFELENNQFVTLNL